MDKKRCQVRSVSKLRRLGKFRDFDSGMGKGRVLGLVRAVIGPRLPVPYSAAIGIGRPVPVVPIGTSAFIDDSSYRDDDKAEPAGDRVGMKKIMGRRVV